MKFTLMGALSIFAVVMAFAQSAGAVGQDRFCTVQTDDDGYTVVIHFQNPETGEELPGYDFLVRNVDRTTALGLLNSRSCGG